MKSIGINYQLRIIILIPILIVSLLFSLLYNGLMGQDLKEHMLRSGEAYIHQLLPAAQFAMIRNEDRILQGIINASATNPDIKALAFYNTEGQLLAYRGGKHATHSLFSPPRFTGEYVEAKQLNATTFNFIAPIIIPKFNLFSDLPFKDTLRSHSMQADDVLGWISIKVDTQALLVKRYKMLIFSIFITLFSLLIGLGVHYFLSKRICLPISRLRRSMKQILKNEFKTEIAVSSYGELGIIEKGCAHLQKKYLCTIQDMNQHIETATQDLQQGLELLEEKNIELTLDKKKIEEKSLQKSEFIANMSHEIRTPMNGVIGFTNILLESKLDPLQIDYVKTIKSSAQDLLTIINEVLDFSKINAGKLQLDCIPLDIRNCIDEVLTLAAPNAFKKGINLIAITEVNVPKTVLGDPVRIRQILTNLITNAIKFTDQGYVLIRTKVEQESEKEYSFSFTISDTGIGISEEEQYKLFTAFNQADISIARRYGGSGLGLVICKKLCEKMHGRISLSSTVNKGSTFTVNLKLDKLLAYEIEKKQHRACSKIKALCFDENPLYLESLCKNLEYLGIECQAIQYFEKLSQALAETSDCNLLFINMNPGYEKQLEELLSKNNKIACILISKSPVNEWSLNTAHGILYKPITMHKLQTLIEGLNENEYDETANHLELYALREQLNSLNPDILIAEDNPVNKMLLTSILSQHSTLLVVDDGEMAVKACEEKKYHMLLLDLQMPKLNGLEAARMIRQHSLLNKKTPIVLITANSYDIVATDLIKSGVDFCLQKPIDEKSLLSQILGVINKTTDSPIDWPLCIQKVSGDRELAETFLAKFAEELQKNRDEFFQLWHQKNLNGLLFTAHKLHGACCFCGVPALEKQVTQLEKQAMSAGNVEELSTCFVELIQHIDAVLNEYYTHYSIKNPELSEQKEALCQ